MRKGHCIEDKFISGLSTATSFLSLNLTDEEIRSIVTKYSIPPGDLIRYVDFVQTIDEQFFNTDMAKSNLSALRQNDGLNSD